MRSLPHDLLEFALLLSLGGVAWCLGRRNSRWPVAVQRIIIAVVLLSVAFVGCVYVGFVPLEGRRILFYLRGPKVVLALCALFLLGVAWHEPKRSFSPVFLIFLAAVAGLMLTIDSSGPLYWRLLGGDAWTHVPDEQGCLKQGTAWSCGPAAAAMLLHRHGIETSEGEMAYLARASFFGTDAFALAQAVDQKAKAMGWTAILEKTDYDECLRRRTPIIAAIRSAGLFAHAVYVDLIDPETVTIIDPGNGIRRLVSRAEFEAKWSGETVRIVRTK